MRGRPPLPFFENQKKCPDFRKKSPDFVHPCVKFTIQNVVLRVSHRKSFEILFDVCLSECPNFMTPSLPRKISACAPDLSIDFLY